MCDVPPYYGRAVAVDVRTHRIVSTWSVVHARGAVVGGGGIWGAGGVSVDPGDGDVYAATGNALYPWPEQQPDAERVARLTPSLVLEASNHPGLRGIDVDFGSTPVLYRTPGCPGQLAVMNKSGALLVYLRDRIVRGPVQRMQMAGNRSRNGLGLFIGLPAFSPGARMLYVANPGPDHAPFRHGLVALRLGSDCRLAPAWQQTAGQEATSPFSSPTVANDVVYFGDGADGRVFALDARTGRRLWDSRDSIGGPVFAPSVIANGRLYVAAWSGGDGGTLYAFGV
jgi:hypothetical protein